MCPHSIHRTRLPCAGRVALYYHQRFECCDLRSRESEICPMLQRELGGSDLLLGLGLHCGALLRV